MEVVDLTRLIEPGMPVFPGTEPPSLEPANTIERNGFAEKIWRMYSHTGTHVDAPAHLFKGGRTLDAYPLGHFMGKAFVPDLGFPEGGRYETGAFQGLEPLIKASDYVLIPTGWHRYWGTSRYFEGYPSLSKEAAAWLAGFGLKGIGFDAISADPVEDGELANHRIFLEREMVIVENLTSMERLKGKGLFDFFCMPLKTKEADGSPVRAGAVLEG